MPKDAPAQLELGALYRAHAQTVARWAHRLAPMLDAEDVVQEVFLIAHRLLPGFRGDAKVTTWLFRITHNVVRHRRRRERLRRLLLGVSTDADGLPSPRPTPVEDLLRRESQQKVYLLLDGMSDRYRTVFILFELEGLPGEELATLLGQKVGTIWVWLHRAREQFQKGLAKMERKERA